MRKVLIVLIVILIMSGVGLIVLKKVISSGSTYSGKGAELTEFVPEKDGYYTLEQNNNAIIYYKVVDSEGSIILEKTSSNNDILYLKPDYKLYYRNADVKEGLTYKWKDSITSGMFLAGTTIDSGKYSLFPVSPDGICSYTISTSPNEYISDIVDEQNIAEEGELEIQEGQYFRYLDCQLTKIE